jgi:hypothetical protein
MVGTSTGSFGPLFAAIKANAGIVRQYQRAIGRGKGGPGGRRKTNAATATTESVSAPLVIPAHDLIKIALVYGPGGFVHRLEGIRKLSRVPGTEEVRPDVSYMNRVIEYNAVTEESGLTTALSYLLQLGAQGEPLECWRTFNTVHRETTGLYGNKHSSFIEII